VEIGGSFNNSFPRAKELHAQRPEHGVVAAVDEQHDAADKTGFRAQQETGGGRLVLGAAGESYRDTRQKIADSLAESIIRYANK